MFTGSVWRDLVYAGRALRRAPAFSLGVIAMLGLGIVASMAMFSVVYGVLLKPFPYVAPDRQVRFRVVTEARNGGAPEVRPLALSVSDTQALARSSRALEHAGNIGLSLTNWRGREPRWMGAAISASAFPMLGVRPASDAGSLPRTSSSGRPARSSSATERGCGILPATAAHSAR